MLDAAVLFHTPDEGAAAEIPPPNIGADTVPSISFGDYDLEREIAHGGMGVVYRAYQRSLRRTVAVKLLLLGRHASKESILRFRREAQSAAALHHPNIVAIHEVGECEGQQFFSMEYVEGLNLAELIRPGPISAREAAFHARTIAEAVHYAHSKGVLHRDLKPSNILVDVVGGLRITDFGLARPLDGSSDITETGRVLGTPHYLAPEAAAGQIGEIGTASDVYAIGAVLYEMLTGRPPFLAPSISETLLRIRDTEPVAPRRLNPAVPADLETICLKCLEKYPASRYPSALALADDLGRWLRHEPITARPVSGFERIVKWMRRNPRFALLLVLTLCAATALVVANIRIRAANARTAAEAEENRRGLVRLNVQTGNQRVNDGDPLSGLAWFVEALSLEHGDPQREDVHRRRIGAVLRGSPVLEQLWFHDDFVTEAAFSPDASRVWILGQKRGLRMWDARAGTSLPAPSDEVVEVRFSPDSRQYLTFSPRGGTQFWKTEDASPVPWLPRLRYGYLAVYNSEGRLAVSTGTRVQLIDPATGGDVAPPWNLPQSVLFMRFTPSGKRLVAYSDHVLWVLEAGNPLAVPLRIEVEAPVLEWALSNDERLAGVVDGTRVRQWDLSEGKSVGPALEHTSSVYSVDYSPEGSRLATAEWGGAAQVWDASTARRVTPPLSHGGGVRWVRFSPDGRNVATASWDMTARIWDAGNAQPRSPMLRHAGFVTALAYSPDGSRLLTGSQDTMVRQWHLPTNLAARLELRHGNTVFRVRYDPGGRWMVSAGADGTARVWDRTSGALRFTLRHTAPVLDARFSPDGRQILTASEDGTARQWDSATGEALRLGVQHGDAVMGAHFSPNGRQFLTRGGKSIRIWDTATGDAIGAPIDRGSEVRCAEFSPDGTRLATGHTDGYVQVWDPAAAQPHGPPIKVGGSAVWTVQFSPDGRRILTAWADDGQLPSAARMWDAATGEPVAAPMVHMDGVYVAEFSPDGRRIVTSSEDNTARVWDALTGEPVTPPLRHRAFVFSAAFSPDGRLVATGSDDGTARVWEAATGEAVTPPLRHEGRAGWVGWSPDGREIVTAWNETAGRVFDVSPHPGAVDHLRHLAEVLGSHRIHPVAGATPLTAAEMRQRWEAIRQER